MPDIQVVTQDALQLVLAYNKRGEDEVTRPEPEPELIRVQIKLTKFGTTKIIEACQAALEKEGYAKIGPGGGD